MSLNDIFRANQILLDTTLNYIFSFFSLFDMHCYSQVSTDFKGTLGPSELWSVMKYFDQDVDYQSHEDVAW